MLTELNLLNPEEAGGETWTRCSPDRLCIADATGPCMVASAVFGPTICDATKGTSVTCAFDVVSGAVEGVPGTLRDANTACEAAETIRWTVASFRLVVAGARTGRTDAGFDEDGRSAEALFSAGFDLSSATPAVWEVISMQDGGDARR